MKNKILFPILTTLSIIPTTLCSCGTTNKANEIIDAVINPTKLNATPITNFKTEFDKLSEPDKCNELIYDCFGYFNNNCTELYEKNDGVFKTNISKYTVTKVNDSYKASLLGYVSYVFGSEHKLTINGHELSFKIDDYIMLTYDFTNLDLVLDETNCSIKISPFVGNCVGFAKIKYNGGQDELLNYIDKIDTSLYTVKNSKNWTK